MSLDSERSTEDGLDSTEKNFLKNLSSLISF